MSSILITGATGFVGSALKPALLQAGHQVHCLSFTQYLAGTGALPDQFDLCVHVAARSATRGETLAMRAAEDQRVNCEGTLSLAKSAYEHGCKRFVFLSTVKVNGEKTNLGRPYRFDSEPAPEDSYGRSKLAAESGLLAFARETGMEVVIIRPPLVYGPGVKGNFKALIRLALSGLPLPLGRIHNLRSFVALENLVDLIRQCLTHPRAPNRVFLVSDGVDVSTPELLRKIGAAYRKRIWLLAVPSSLIHAVGRLVRLQHLTRRLCGSLQLDISATCETLDWRPPLDMDTALSRMAATD